MQSWKLFSAQKGAITIPLINGITTAPFTTMEHTRFELVTSSMPWKRAPNCANAPSDIIDMPWKRAPNCANAPSDIIDKQTLTHEWHSCQYSGIYAVTSKVLANSINFVSRFGMNTPFFQIIPNFDFISGVIGISTKSRGLTTMDE